MIDQLWRSFSECYRGKGKPLVAPLTNKELTDKLIHLIIVATLPTRPRQIPPTRRHWTPMRRPPVIHLTMARITWVTRMHFFAIRIFLVAQ
jgi:hypothetical protein